MDYRSSTICNAKTANKTLIILFFIASLPLTLTAQSSVSDTVTVTAIVVDTNPPSSPPAIPSAPAGGGGGGNIASIPLTSQAVVFKGITFPKGNLFILQGGSVIQKGVADATGMFEVTLTNIGAGIQSLGVRAEDTSGKQTSTHYMQVAVAANITTLIDNIILSPTISSDYERAERGQTILFFGKGVPNSSLELVIDTRVLDGVKVRVDASGSWKYALDTTSLTLTNHGIKVRSLTPSVSKYSVSLGFLIGDAPKKRIETDPQALCKDGANADFNCDSKVSLTDLSILAFWYKKTGFASYLDLNKDNKIDLQDLSILAYRWTG